MGTMVAVTFLTEMRCRHPLSIATARKRNRKVEHDRVSGKRRCYIFSRVSGFWMCWYHQLSIFGFERCWYTLLATGVYVVFEPMLYRPSSSADTLVTEK